MLRSASDRGILDNAPLVGQGSSACRDQLPKHYSCYADGRPVKSSGCALYIGIWNFTLQQNSKLGVCTIHEAVLYSKLYG